MTRSDIIIAVHRHEPDELVHSLHTKIENVYKIVFELEKESHFQELAGLIREALQSETLL